MHPEDALNMHLPGKHTAMHQTIYCSPFLEVVQIGDDCGGQLADNGLTMVVCLRPRKDQKNRGPRDENVSL